MATPRVPALHIDTQRYDLSSEITPTSAMSLANDIQKTEIEQNERAKESGKHEEEHEAKRQKVTEATESSRRSKSKQSKESVLRQEKEVRVVKQAESTAKPKELQTVQKADGEAEALKSDVLPPVDMMETDTKEAIVAEEEEEEEDDFLPGIIDDDGPDEDDV